MSLIVTKNEDSLTCVSICLACHAEFSNLLAERCSDLFENKLRYIFDEIFSDVQQRYPLPKVISRLAVDLGEIPLAEFEVQFCQRIAKELVLELKKYRTVSTEQLSDQFKLESAVSTTLPSAITGEKTDNAAAFRRYLQHGYWPLPEAWLNEGGIRAWLMARRKVEPDLWEALIARACLFPLTRRRLWRLVAPDTWRHWLEVAEPVTQHALLLGALRYFQQNPQQSLSLPEVEAEVLVMPVAGNEDLLTRLFSTETPPPLVPWLAALWRHPPLRAWLESRLSASRVETVRLKLAESGLPDYKAVSAALQKNVPASAQESGLPDYKSVSAALQKNAPASAQEPALNSTAMSVCNAGLILLWPLLPDLFTRLGPILFT